MTTSFKTAILSLNSDNNFHGASWGRQAPPYLRRFRSSKTHSRVEGLLHTEANRWIARQLQTPPTMTSSAIVSSVSHPVSEMRLHPKWRTVGCYQEEVTQSKRPSRQSPRRRTSSSRASRGSGTHKRPNARSRAWALRHWQRTLSEETWRVLSLERTTSRNSASVRIQSRGAQLLKVHGSPLCVAGSTRLQSASM